MQARCAPPSQLVPPPLALLLVSAGAQLTRSLLGLMNPGPMTFELVSSGRRQGALARALRSLCIWGSSEVAPTGSGQVGVVCGPGGSSDGARAPPAHAHPLSIVLSPPPCAQTRLCITLRGACAQKWGTNTRCPFASISPLPSLHITPTLQNTHQPPSSPPHFEPVTAPLTLILVASCRSPSCDVSTR